MPRGTRRSRRSAERSSPTSSRRPGLRGGIKLPQSWSLASAYRPGSSEAHRHREGFGGQEDRRVPRRQGRRQGARPRPPEGAVVPLHHGRRRRRRRRRGHVMEEFVFPNTYKRWSLVPRRHDREAGSRVGGRQRRRRHARGARRPSPRAPPSSSSPPTTKASSSATRPSRSCEATRSSTIRATSRRRRSARPPRPRRRAPRRRRRTRRRSSRQAHAAGGRRRPAHPRPLLRAHAGEIARPRRQALHRRLRSRRGGVRTDVRPHLGCGAHSLHVARVLHLRSDYLSVGHVHRPPCAWSSIASSTRRAFVPVPYWELKATLEYDGDPFEVGSRQGSLRHAGGDGGGLRRGPGGYRPRTRPSHVRTSLGAVRRHNSTHERALRRGMTPRGPCAPPSRCPSTGLMSYPRTDNTCTIVHGSLRELSTGAPSPPPLPGWPGRTSSRRRAARSAPPTTRRSTPVGAPEEGTRQRFGQGLRPGRAALPRHAARPRCHRASARRRRPRPGAVPGLRRAGRVAGLPRGVREVRGQARPAAAAAAAGRHAQGPRPPLEAKETQPPGRYGQGKLIEKMEDLGLGTKATRADIIQHLYDRNYVRDNPVEPSSAWRSSPPSTRPWRRRRSTSRRVR